MKTPPLLILAALLFWGWQTDFLVVAVVMGVMLEAARFVKFRWDLDDADFSRIWGFCSVLNIALMIYAFTNNEAGGLGSLPHGSTGVAAVNASVVSATRFLRWLPMTTFAFIAAQMFNMRDSVPLTGISLVLRWRRRKGSEEFSGRYLNVSYPYFLLCVFSAGIRANNATFTYFFGVSAFALWALWSVRSRRYRSSTWLLAVVAVAGIGVGGIFGLNQAQRALQNFNAQWMARFFGSRTDPQRSLTSMGSIGDLKLSAKIVIWLQPREVGRTPEYLREATYRLYESHKQAWYAGGPMREFVPLHPDPDNSTWPLVPGKKTTDAVNIACYLSGWSHDLEAPAGLLPLPSGCGSLENIPADVMVLKKNPNGAVLAAGRGLLIFDAHYGPGVTLDAPPDALVANAAGTNHFDAFVPTNEIPALDAAIAEMNLPANADDTQKCRAVQKFFFDNFTYSTWQGKDKRADTNGTPLTKFLTKSRSGHCEYFATATVLLLRELGIPARYAVGYYVHEPRGTGFIARERDAHAWCLAWNRVKGNWEDFDTTPPSWVGVEEKRTHIDEWMANVTSWLKFQFAKFRWRQANLQQYIFWSLIPVLLVLLYHIIFRRRGKLFAAKEKKNAAAEIIWPGLDSEFYELEKKLAARGLPRQNGEPLSGWLERAVAYAALRDLRKPLRELLKLHYRHRFDPHGLSAAEREELRRKAVSALEKISAAAAK